jgi:hypothetical protein
MPLVSLYFLEVVVVAIDFTEVLFTAPLCPAYTLVVAEVAPGGGVGGGRAPNIVSRCVATPSKL